MAPPPRLCTVLHGTSKVISFLVGTSSARRQALLLHRLGPEGRRIFDALPQPTPSPLAATAAGKAGKSSKPDRPDPYDASLLTLTRHFAARCNVRVERKRFRECRQLCGEPAADFALTLQELSADCNIAAQADENMCDQLLLEGDTLTFHRAVEIAQLREQSARESELLQTLSVASRRKLHGDGSQPDGTVEGAVILTAAHADRPSRNSGSVVPHSGSNGPAACGNCGTSTCDLSRCPARVVVPASDADAAVIISESVDAPVTTEGEVQLESMKWCRTRMQRASLAFFPSTPTSVQESTLTSE
ncbi:hypothetical protein HPB47_008225 [Ixodes persulcatus]|uniref:Uncharacterized protein n=1 Tax=Ixodes persulcatus TaxID=34615 RepID=A0AC60P5D9_IXOPE|nr:hypothetical protein HPB47_008225 [Ixodes persulcatus]